MLIRNNLAKSQLEHTSQCRTAHAAWTNLEAMHVHQTVTAYTRDLYRSAALRPEDGDDIAEHFKRLERIWQSINLVASPEYKISVNKFKQMIASSLPPFWDVFTGRFIGCEDNKAPTSPQQLISIIVDEAERRASDDRKWQTSCRARQGNTSNRSSGGRTPQRSTQRDYLHCKQCNRRNHKTEGCRYLGKSKCEGWGKFGHATTECWGSNAPPTNIAKKRKYANANCNLGAPKMVCSERKEEAAE